MRMDLLAASDGVWRGHGSDPVVAIRILVVGFDCSACGSNSGSMDEEEKTGLSYRPAHAVLA